MKFRLLAGDHIEAGTPLPDGRTTDKIYHPGDIIDAKMDLAQRYGADKFQRIYQEEQQREAAVEEEKKAKAK